MVVVNVMTVKNFMTRDAPLHNLTTDASNKGWGAVYANQSTGSLWSSAEKNRHINYLELLTVFLGLKAFCNSHHDMHIALRRTTQLQLQ